MKFQYGSCIIAVPNLHLNSFFLPLAEKTMEYRLEIHRIFSFLLFKSVIGVILRPSSHNWNKTSLRLVVSIAVDLLLHLHVYQRHIKKYGIAESQSPGCNGNTTGEEDEEKIVKCLVCFIRSLYRLPEVMRNH